MKSYLILVLCLLCAAALGGCASVESIGVGATRDAKGTVSGQLTIHLRSPKGLTK